MREENPSPNNTTGPKTAKDKLEDLNARLTRNSLFDILAEYEHDYREADGKRIHDCSSSAPMGVRRRIGSYDFWLSAPMIVSFEQLRL
jgi:hypothetical protein